MPRSEHLPTNQLLELLLDERDPDRRWQIIEPNLMLGRAERIYPLILNYTELIAARVQPWPPARLKAAFGSQPAAVLIAIMPGWRVNQVLAVTEDHAEAKLISEWLRERELERLLRLDLQQPVTTALQARELLCLDRFADEPAIKKTWRTLLGFMNADLGRQQERAIHRKKDEIAKHLQQARNLLLKGGR